MRVLVCGGRDFDQAKALGRALTALHAERPFSLIVTGGAAGADYWAGRWAAHERLPLCTFPPHWKTMGKRAGPVRNGWMLEFARPELVVAFPRANGRIGEGTADMTRQAIAAGVKVVFPMNPATPETVTA